MKKYIPFLLIIIVTSAVYSGVPGAGFLRDDFPQIIENRWITSPGYIPEIFSSPLWAHHEGDFVSGSSNYYRPMLHIVNMGIYHVFGQRPAGYHLVSLIIHNLNAILVYLIACTVLSGALAGGRSTGGRTETEPVSPLFPLSAALIFALHPVNAEAVTWVAAVLELSFTFFCLVSFYLYAVSYTRVRAAILLYLISLASYAIGLFSKETAVFLPALLFIYDYADGRLSLKSLVRYLPYAAVTGLFMLIRSRIVGPMSVEHEMTPLQYVLSVAAITGKYIGKLVFPFGLKLYYAFRPTGSITGFFNHEVLISLFLAAVVLYSLYRARDRRIALCVFWILIPLSPAVFLIKYIQGEWVFAARYLYLPSAGFAILCVLIYRAFFRAGPGRGGSAAPENAIAVFVLPLLVFYSASTAAAVRTWKDEFSYWKKAVEDAPESATAHGSLGVAYAEAGLYTEAVNEYEQALALAPESGGLYMNIGVIYYNVREFDKALPMFRKALDFTKNESTRTNILFSLGKVYYQKGMFAEAAESFEEAALRAASDDLYNWLGMAYAGAGAADKAVEAFNEALRLNPENSSAGQNLQKMLEASR